MLSFRVFVSSTFDDMRAEREALHAGVFPSVTEYCAARVQRFTLRAHVVERRAHEDAEGQHSGILDAAAAGE